MNLEPRKPTIAQLIYDAIVQRVVDYVIVSQRFDYLLARAIKGDVDALGQLPGAATDMRTAAAAATIGVTGHDLVVMFGRWRAISGLHQLRVMGKIQCDKLPRYSLTPDAERPQDRRGRKRA